MSTYRDKRLSVPTLPLGVILAGNLVTILHALSGREALAGRRGVAALTAAREGERGVAGEGAGDGVVNAEAGVFLCAGVGGEDFDGVVDAGDGEEGFVSG